MSIIYSVSDIHGSYEAMMDTLSRVDLHSDRDNKLILLGDYVDRGLDSCKVLYHIKTLEREYPNQVIVLLGNHDQMFIDWMTQNDDLNWLDTEENMRTVRSFFKESQFNDLVIKLNTEGGGYSDISAALVETIKEDHEDLLKWFMDKNTSPLYYETMNQIYVHAGICEVDEGLWKHATEPSEFTWKYPAETGYFYKDIIAGHNSTVEVSNDTSYHGKVYWDGESHFFIDGDTPNSGSLPLLKYYTDTKTYSCDFEQTPGNWVEYHIKKIR